MKTQLSAMECALAGLVDYAGMFPPAELDLSDALQGYLGFRHGPHAWVLGNLVVNARALHVLTEETLGVLRDLPLSVIANASDLEIVQAYLDQDLPIAMIELKAESCDEIAHWKENIFARVATYVEIPVSSEGSDLLDAINKAGMHAKIRMGGVVAQAFPHAASVAATLKKLAEKRIAFKATAGLHHPLRSRHPFTYQRDSQSGVMHGFMNLLCAAALIWFGGCFDEAGQLLEEHDPQAWQATSDAIEWRSHRWNADQLREVRERFMIRIGSCSFSEPIHDLEALGWL